MGLSKKIIIFAYYYLPDNTSGVQRAVRMAKYLPHYGIDPVVITSSQSGIEPGLGGVEYVPVPDNRAPDGLEMLARLAQRIAPYNECLEWTPHAIHAADKIIAHAPVEAIISTSPPLVTHAAALATKMRHGVRWIADFRDPLCGNPGRSRRWAKRYDQALERLIFSAADQIVAVTDTVAEDWALRYPQWRKKYQVIWNGFDPEEMLHAEAIPSRNYREIAHVGVLYAQRHPYSLVSAAERLIERGRIDPEAVRFRFVGPILEQQRFEQNTACAALLRRGCLEIQSDLLPRSEANHVIATADALLLIDIVNLSRAGYTVPAKLYDYVLIGRPVLTITDRQSPVERILTRSEVPHVCLYHGDSEEETETKLLHFLSLSSDPVQPSAWFRETFDGRRQAGTFVSLIRPARTA